MAAEMSSRIPRNYEKSAKFKDLIVMETRRNAEWPNADTVYGVSCLDMVGNCV